MAKSFDALVRRTTTKTTRVRGARRARELFRELLLSDTQISTLRKIVQALGGELEVLAKFPTGTVKIGQFERARSAANK